MSTLAGILATAALSHLGGHIAGGVFARLGIAGFGRKLKVARHVLRVGRALRKAFDFDSTAKSREDLLRRLGENDPRNETGLGDGVP